MEEQFKNPEEEQDNVISLEKKLEEKKEEDSKYSKQFERTFFEYKDNVAPIEKGLEIQSEREISPKQKALGKQLADRYAMMDDFEGELDRAREEGRSEDEIARLKNLIQKEKEDIEATEKELEKTYDELEKFNKRANEIKNKRIYE